MNVFGISAFVILSLCAIATSVPVQYFDPQQFGQNFALGPNVYGIPLNYLLQANLGNRIPPFVSPYNNYDYVNENCAGDGLSAHENPR